MLHHIERKRRLLFVKNKFRLRKSLARVRLQNPKVNKSAKVSHDCSRISRVRTLAKVQICVSVKKLAKKINRRILDLKIHC